MMLNNVFGEKIPCWTALDGGSLLSTQVEFDDFRPIYFW